jgi:hypothetical protein
VTETTRKGERCGGREGQITIQSRIVEVNTAERKGKGKCREDGVVWQAQPGRWRGARPLVMI